MLNERDRAMLDELERNKNVKQTQRRNRQGGWSMTGNAERALAGGALLKIDVEVNRLSECQTNLVGVCFGSFYSNVASRSSQQ